MKKFMLMGGASLLSLLCCANMAKAQTAQPTDDTQLEEIIVTAQKRSEQSQKVPITVSAFSAQQIKDLGVTSTQDLVANVPGLKFGASISTGTPYLRGVGHNIGGIGDESPIATYSDGVYVANGMSNILSLPDVERVEVLAGPQGTLFGRNATGGVIQIITKAPSHTSSADVEVGYGNYDTVTASLYGTTGITDTVATSVTFSYDNQQNGWGRNVTLNQPVNKGSSETFRNKWLWEPTSRTSLILVGTYNKRRGDTSNALTIVPGAIGADRTSRNVGYYNTALNSFSRVDNKAYAVSGTLKQDLDWAEFTAVAAYQDFKGRGGLDVDGSSAFLGAQRWLFTERTFTFEPQLSSASSSSKFKWTVGLFYMHDDTVSDLTLTGSAFPTSPRIIGNGFTRSYAAYGQSTYAFTPSTHLTLGLRYTSDQRSLTGNNGAAPIQEVNRTWNKLTYRASLDHELAKDIMAYVEYNRGFKSGFFNLQSPSTPLAEPEVLDAYEAGIKSQLFGRRLRLNISAFYYDYKGLQQKAINVGAPIYFNSNAHIKGLDVDLAAKVASGLTLRGGFEVLDPNYVYFPNAPLSTKNPVGGNFLTSGDVAGNTLIQASKFSGSAGFDYRADTSLGGLTVNMTYAYASKFYWDADNRLAQPGYGLLNASARLTIADGKFDVRIWGKNLTGEKFAVFESGSSRLGDIYFPGAPRTYGVTLGTHF
ncbi:MAG TPA: TonB-dependent receptor [Sphingobium sp.]